MKQLGKQCYAIIDGYAYNKKNIHYWTMLLPAFAGHPFMKLVGGEGLILITGAWIPPWAQSINTQLNIANIGRNLRPSGSL